MLFSSVFIVLFFKAIVAQLPYDPVPLPNIWSFGQKMDLYVYANNEPLQNRFDDEKELVAKVDSIIFGEEIKNIKFYSKLLVDLKEPPLFLHIHLIKAGIHPDPLKSPFDITNSIYRRHPLIRSMKKPAAQVNLLKQKPETEVNEQVPIWYPKITLNLVNHQDPIPFATFPAQIRRLIYADRIRKAYFPVIYVNEFWDLKGKQMSLQSGPKQEMPLQISFSTTSWNKFWWMTQLLHAIRQHDPVNKEFYNIKQILLESASWLIVLTVAITILLIVFRFSALKHDKKNSDLTRLSVKGVLINSVFKMVIFKYLLDSESSLLLTASVGIGALIEIKKIKRVLQLHWLPVNGGRFWFPVLRDRSAFQKEKTIESNREQYLYATAIPLLLAYSLWSLKNEKYKNWISWGLYSLAGLVYTFTFISIFSPLFDNCKLKSVTPISGNALIYKTLSTFVDNLYAFVLPVPQMYRLASLSNDLTYFVYLYQLYAYRVDKTLILKGESQSKLKVK